MLSNIYSYSCLLRPQAAGWKACKGSLWAVVLQTDRQTDGGWRGRGRTGEWTEKPVKAVSFRQTTQRLTAEAFHEDIHSCVSMLRHRSSMFLKGLLLQTNTFLKKYLSCLFSSPHFPSCNGNAGFSSVPRKAKDSGSWRDYSTDGHYLI